MVPIRKNAGDDRKPNPVEQHWKHSKFSDFAYHIPDVKYELYLDVYDSPDRKRTDGRLLRSNFHQAGPDI